MQIATLTAVHKQAKRVAIRETDVALVEIVFADILINEVADEAEAVIESRAPRVVVSEKRVIMLHADISAIVKSRDVKARVTQYEQTEDVRVAYVHVLRFVETEFMVALDFRRT